MTHQNYSIIHIINCIVIIIGVLILIYLLIINNKYILKLFGKGTDECFKITLLNNPKYFQFYVDQNKEHYYNKITFIESNLRGCLWFLNLKELKKIISEKTVTTLNEHQLNYNTLNMLREEKRNINNFCNDIKIWLSTNKTTKYDIILFSFKDKILNKHRSLFNDEQLQKINNFNNGKNY